MGVGVGVGVLYCQYRLSRKSSQVKNIIKKFKMASIIDDSSDIFKLHSITTHNTLYMA